MNAILKICTVCALTLLMCGAKSNTANAVRTATDASGKVRVTLPLLSLAPEKSRHDPLLTQLRFGGMLNGELVGLEMHLPIASEWNGIRSSVESTKIDSWAGPIWLGTDSAECTALLRQLAKFFKQKATPYKCSGRAIAVTHTMTDPALLSTTPIKILIRFDSAKQEHHAVINFTIDLPRKVLIIDELQTDSVNRLAFLNGFAREGM
jgi:hypothetical protein